MLSAAARRVLAGQACSHQDTLRKPGAGSQHGLEDKRLQERVPFAAAAGTRSDESAAQHVRNGVGKRSSRIAAAVRCQRTCMLELEMAVAGRACWAMAARAGLCTRRPRCTAAGALQLSGAPHMSARFNTGCRTVFTALHSAKQCC